LSRSSKPRCLIGFDGFTDAIYRVVKTRRSADDVTYFPTIRSFTERLQEGAGVSCNIELVEIEKRVGGNAPLMAESLMRLGAEVDFIGTISREEPLFASFINECHSFYSLAHSAHSDALEFSDGKIILGKHSSILHVDDQTLKKCTALKELFEAVEMVAMVNWTMLPGMNSIWHYLQNEGLCRGKLFFFDLADPAKRTAEDLREAIKLIAGFDRSILGLNASEAAQVAALCGSAFPHNLGIKEIVVHTKTEATTYADGKSWIYANSLITNPVTTTGAGDNFNAGYTFARLLGYDFLKSLEMGCQVARAYIAK
jgi:hypothetical protein